MAGLAMRLRALGRALEPTAQPMPAQLLQKSNLSSSAKQTLFQEQIKMPPASLLGHVCEPRSHTMLRLVFFMQLGGDESLPQSHSTVQQSLPEGIPGASNRTSLGDKNTQSLILQGQEELGKNRARCDRFWCPFIPGKPK